MTGRQTIVIAVDRSEYSEIVVEHGLDAAVRAGPCDVHVVTVVEEQTEAADVHRWLHTFVGEAVDAFGLGVDWSTTAHVRHGDPVEQLRRVVSELGADLLVIGRFDPHRATSERLLEVIDRPTLVVGIDGTVLEPQCPACMDERRASNGERLFCADHSADDVPDLVSRLPPPGTHGSRLW